MRVIPNHPNSVVSQILDSYSFYPSLIDASTIILRYRFCILSFRPATLAHPAEPPGCPSNFYKMLACGINFFASLALAGLAGLVYAQEFEAADFSVTQALLEQGVNILAFPQLAALVDHCSASACSIAVSQYISIVSIIGNTY